MQTMVRLTPQMPGTVGISAVAGGEEIDDEPSNNPVFITRDVMAARRRGRLPGPATAQARQSS
jgi:hypothetical protein